MAQESCLPSLGVGAACGLPGEGLVMFSLAHSVPASFVHAMLLGCLTKPLYLHQGPPSTCPFGIVPPPPVQILSRTLRPDHYASPIPSPGAPFRPPLAAPGPTLVITCLGHCPQELTVPLPPAPVHPCRQRAPKLQGRPSQTAAPYPRAPPCPVRSQPPWQP